MSAINTLPRTQEWKYISLRHGSLHPAELLHKPHLAYLAAECPDDSCLGATARQLLVESACSEHSRLVSWHQPWRGRGTLATLTLAVGTHRTCCFHCLSLRRSRGNSSRLPYDDLGMRSAICSFVQNKCIYVALGPRALTLRSIARSEGSIEAPRVGPYHRRTRQGRHLRLQTSVSTAGTAPQTSAEHQDSCGRSNSNKQPDTACKARRSKLFCTLHI